MCFEGQEKTLCPSFSFPVPHIPLSEIYFCVLWKLLDISACLIQMEIYIVCKILNTFQVIDFVGSVLKVKVRRNGNLWERAVIGGKGNVLTFCLELASSTRVARWCHKYPGKL